MGPHISPLHNPLTLNQGNLPLKNFHLRANYWFKYLCTGCAIYIQIICLCNLVGFGYGYENTWVVVSRIGDEWLNFMKMSAIVISACVLMFAIRRYEYPRRNF